LTIAAVAANKAIQVKRINVEVQRQTVEGPDRLEEPEDGVTQGRSSLPPWRTSFVIRLDLGPGLAKRERAILLGVARHCEVGKMLRGQMRWDYGWADGDV